MTMRITSSFSRKAGQRMGTEHRRPLYAFLAVFVVAMLVVAGAARSDALRDLVREQAADIVAAPTFDLDEEHEPEAGATVTEVDVPDAEPVSSPAPAPLGDAARSRAVRQGESGRAGRASGPVPAGAPGKAGDARAGAPGRARGHAHAHAHTPGKAKGQGKGQGKARGHQQGRGHDHGQGKGHRKHGH